MRDDVRKIQEAVILVFGYLKQSSQLFFSSNSMGDIHDLRYEVRKVSIDISHSGHR